MIRRQLIMFISRIISLHYFTIVFLFNMFAILQDLHSFPTRRSSDLDPGTWEKFGDIFTTIKDVVTEMWPRSEEHTSELQLRGHLVCRHLLEKKKNEVVIYIFEN